MVGDLHGKLDDLLVILYKVSRFLTSISSRKLSIYSEWAAVAHKLLRFQRWLCWPRQEELRSIVDSFVMLSGVSRMRYVESRKSWRCGNEPPLWLYSRSSSEISKECRSIVETDWSSVSPFATRNFDKQQDIRSAWRNIWVDWPEFNRERSKVEGQTRQMILECDCKILLSAILSTSPFYDRRRNHQTMPTTKWSGSKWSIFCGAILCNTTPRDRHRINEVSLVL